MESLNEDAGNIYKKGGLKALMEIPGVGEGIAFKIEEYLKTGKIKELAALKKKTPVDLEELIRVEGLGTRKVKILYQKLGVRNIKDLEKAAKTRKIAPLFGFGEKTEKNILEGIEFLKRSRGRFLLGEILPKVKEIESALKNLKEAERVEACGSVRRGKETIGDVDFLVASDKPKKIMDFFFRFREWLKFGARARLRLRSEQETVLIWISGWCREKVMARLCNISPAQKNIILFCGKSPLIRAINFQNMVYFAIQK